MALRAERLDLEAQLKLLAGDIGAFLDCQSERYELADDAGLDTVTARAAGNLGFALLVVGSYDQAEAVMRAGLEPLATPPPRATCSSSAPSPDRRPPSSAVPCASSPRRTKHSLRSAA